MAWFSLTAPSAVSTESATEARPLTTADVKALYARPPSFTDFLPWVEYLPDSRCFLLEDGVSVGVLFELTPAGTEARTPGFMTELRDAIQTAITEAIPELDDAPWILQLYVQDEPSLSDLVRDVEAYVPPGTSESAYTRHYLSLLKAHCARISRPGGLFEDSAPRGRVPSALEVEAELNDVAIKWTAALAAAGIRCRRGSGEDLYRWLLPWFNPRPDCAQGDVERLLIAAPYPGDEDLPFGADLGEVLTLSCPKSENGSATWWFDGLPHTVVTVQGLRRAPDVGHMTAERPSGDHVCSLFDRLPEHTVMVLTVTVKPQDLVRNHVGLVKRAAVGDSAEAELTREDELLAVVIEDFELVVSVKNIGAEVD